MNRPWSESRMREIRTSGLMSGEWKRSGLAATAPLLDSTGLLYYTITVYAYRSNIRAKIKTAERFCLARKYRNRTLTSNSGAQQV
jgi:hypothetical protein